MAGGTIPTYLPDNIRKLAIDSEREYKKNLTKMLTFEDWKSSANNTLYKHSELFSTRLVDYTKPVNVSYSSKEYLDMLKEHQAEFDDIQINSPDSQKDIRITKLCKSILKPKIVIDRPDGFKTKGELKIHGEPTEVDVPIWYASTLKGVNLRLGYANMDSALPGAMRLDNDCAHGMFGGSTGSGKSVGVNTMAMQAMHEYAPWELEFRMIDLKIVELSRYANRIKSPHVSFVGATGSTEFVMSLLDELRREMAYRQELFESTGVVQLQEFRTKYNLVMPRIVLLVDEFVQLFENLKDAEQAGCTDIDEQRTAIKSAISAIARQGRSMGIHMLLSSQNLNGVLDDQTAGQFQAGATLKAEAAVSIDLIGNDAGARILGKGKGIVNNNKLAKDESMNIYTRVPFLDSEQSEEDAAAGKLNYFQKLLSELREKADEVGWDNRLVYYNEKEIIPYAMFSQDLEKASELEIEPNTGNPITDELFKSEITRVITIGREVKYSETGLSLMKLKQKRTNSILVAGTNIADREYAINLLIENLKSPKFSHSVITADNAITAMTQITRKLQNAEVIHAKTFPWEIYSKYLLRKEMMEYFTVLQDKNNSEWNTDLVVNKAIQLLDIRVGNELNKLTDKIDKILGDLDELNDSEENPMEDLENQDMDLSEIFDEYDIDSYNQPKYVELVNKIQFVYQTLKVYTSEFTKDLKIEDLSKEFVWFLGIDEMSDITSYDTKALYQELIDAGPAYGIHSIVTGTLWDKVGAVVENIEYIIEKCDKSFFTSISMPVKVNINKNSLQILGRQSKVSTIVKKYQMS